MDNPNEFYKATINKQPSGLIRKFFNFKYNEKMIGNITVDLGCGAGNDTEFLICSLYYLLLCIFYLIQFI